MSWPNSYGAPAPTIPAGGEYSSPSPIYAATTQVPAGSYYQNNGFATILASTSVSTTIGGPGLGDNRDWRGCTLDRTPNQGAIIALGVVCGLLIIGLAVLLFFIFYLGWRHKKGENLKGGLTITPGYQSMGRHNHRYGRTEYSKGGTDDLTDYLTRLDRPSLPRKDGRNHRISHPVTNEEYEGLNRAEITPAQWGNLGIQPDPTQYAQFPNPGAPVYFSAGQVNGQAVPVVPGPINPAPAPPQQRGRDEESAGGPSEISSSSQEEFQGSGRRHSSVRRHHSKTSSSARGRPGRN